jgi:hypothetical protein
MQLPFGFACLIEIKHFLVVNQWTTFLEFSISLALDWKYFIEFIVSIIYVFSMFIILPIILLVHGCRLKHAKHHYQPFFRQIAKNILLGTIVWATFPIY